MDTTPSAPHIGLLYVPGANIHRHLGMLYVITSDRRAFEKLQKLFREASQDLVLHPFTPIHVTAPSDFDDPALASSLTGEQVTFVSLVFSPAEGIPLFLTQRSSGDDLIIEAAEFTFEVDRRTREALADIVDGLLGSENVPKSPGGEISFRGRRPQRIGKEEKQLRLKEAREAFVESVKLERAKKDPKASQTIDLVINNLTESSKLLLIRKYIDTLSEEEIQNLYEESVDMKALAERSRVKIIVRKRHDDPKDLDHYEDIVGTLGEYRICYYFGDDKSEHLLDFQSKADNAVYLSCLLVRSKQGDEDVNFEDLEELFIGSFRLIYGDSYYNARNNFLLLLDDYDEISQRVRQGRLKNCISGIRSTIDGELLHKENPSIFYYKKNRQLGVLKRNIIIPDGLYDIVKNLGKNPSASIA